MTSPSQAARRLAFEYRAEARNQRAKAAEMGDYYYEFSRKFPGHFGRDLREIFDNLDVRLTAAKARDLYERMREAYPQMVRDGWGSLEPNWQWEDMDAVRTHLFHMEDAIGAVRILAEHLEAAIDLDKAYDSMMEVADFYVEIGQ